MDLHRSKSLASCTQVDGSLISNRNKREEETHKSTITPPKGQWTQAQKPNHSSLARILALGSLWRASLMFRMKAYALEWIVVLRGWFGGLFMAPNPKEPLEKHT
jgi:hypothetical protein